MKQAKARRSGASDGQDLQKLAELRAKIDAIDESIHGLLIQRASVIDELISAKGAVRTGAAFRPGREADMMRRIAARHRGDLPLSAIEHIWREIISTFTHMQAPYTVHVATEGGIAHALDAARFTFGFTVPLALHDNAADAIAALAGANAVAVIPLGAAGAWWRMLGGPGNPAIMARLPFLRIAGRNAGLDAVVIAPPLSDPAPFEVAITAVTLPAGFPVPASGEGAEILGGVAGVDETELLVAGALPASVKHAALDIRPAGGYFAPFTPAD
ncbi:MAG TPA: chorismate mutase [Rhizobiaceae bacterium]|nr:chorismate mutase [Rhizobiaceae bacterium]